MPYRRGRWRSLGVSAGAVIVTAVLLGLFWDWNWFRPIIQARLSTALGRSVTVDRLEVHPGRTTKVSVFGLTAANPAEFDGPHSATIERVTVFVEVETWLRSRRIVIPS